MDGMVDATLRVTDLAFSDDLTTSARQDIRTALKKYESDCLLMSSEGRRSNAHCFTTL
jgi:hypothetical protein